MFTRCLGRWCPDIVRAYFVFATPLTASEADETSWSWSAQFTRDYGAFRAIQYAREFGAFKMYSMRQRLWHIQSTAIDCAVWHGGISINSTYEISWRNEAITPANAPPNRVHWREWLHFWKIWTWFTGWHCQGTTRNTTETTASILFYTPSSLTRPLPQSSRDDILPNTYYLKST